MAEKNRNRRIWLPLLLLGLVMLLSAGGVLARYLTTSRTQWQMVSAGFHINSETLKEDSLAPSYPAFCDPVTGYFTIPLHNYEVENIQAISELEITYRISLSAGATLVSVKNGDLNVPGITEGGVTVYRLPAGTVSTPTTTHTLTIDPGTAQTVMVTVDTTYPYIKQLHAVFTPSTGITVTIRSRTEGGQYVTLHTNQYSGPLTLTWPGTMIPTAGINEEVYGWSVGYYTGTGGAYDSVAYIAEAEKEHDYVFEFVAGATGSSVDNATGTVTLS